MLFPAFDPNTSKKKTENAVLGQFSRIHLRTSHPAITCSKLKIETLEQCVKYVQT